MGRMLGSFDPEDELDRPDLNKCPDCGCYFATDNCPLCGKVCPPEMRAGARVEPKKRRKRRAGSGRVQFIPWYHTWWFILLMMFWMPPVGIILFPCKHKADRGAVPGDLSECVAGVLLPERCDRRLLRDGADRCAYRDGQRVRFR